MRRCVLGVAVACGCSFRLGVQETSDAASARPDAPRMTDGETVTACVAASAGSALDDSGTAGGTGGTADATMILSCDQPTDLIIGLALLMSEQSTCNGEQSAAGIAITCASLTIDSDGSVVVGSSYSHSAMGNGGCNWTPAMWTPVASCPPGAVVTGFDVHTGILNDLFLDATMSCTGIGSDGTLIGGEVSVPIIGSLDETHGDSSVTCDSGHALQELLPHDGAGLDAVELHCGPLTCGSAS
jgi:hypothetical protein